MLAYCGSREERGSSSLLVNLNQGSLVDLRSLPVKHLTFYLGVLLYVQARGVVLRFREKREGSIVLLANMMVLIAYAVLVNRIEPLLNSL